MRRIDSRLLPLLIRIGALAVAVCIAPSGFAAVPGEAPGRDQGAGDRVLTNRDLPELPVMDASRERLPEGVPVGSGGPRPVELSERATPAERPSAGEKKASDEEMTVPELLDELDRLRKRERRVRVPYISRRYAAPTAEERKAEQGLSNVGIVARLERQQAEIRSKLRERGAEIPAREFGRPAPLYETNLTEEGLVVVEEYGEYSRELVARTDDPETAAFETQYRLSELAAPVSQERFGDGQPETLFPDELDEVPVVRPR